MLRLGKIDAASKADSELQAQLVRIRETRAKYALGFAEVNARIDGGEIKTVVEANTAITPYKPALHKLETETQELGRAHFRGARNSGASDADCVRS